MPERACDAWEFWIDVGGTFTDCIARSPDGTVKRAKVLSSASMRGRGRVEDGGRVLIDDARQVDPTGLWDRAALTIRDDRGAAIATSTVLRFHPARGFELADPVEIDAPSPVAYDVVSDEEAPVLGIRRLLEIGRGDPIPPCSLRLGTTRATNALITRTGARTVLLTTHGFGDLLRIGYQDRPRLFDLDIRKPAGVFESVVEIRERMDADGNVLAAPDRERVRSELRRLHDNGIESVAICFLHAYANDEHERIVESMAREVGFTSVSRSSLVAPVIDAVARGQTTVVDAYLNPVLATYIDRIAGSLDPASELRFMTSAGGLATHDTFRGRDAILSGPAGGVVGLAEIARLRPALPLLGFDMGGTSTDVSRYAGAFERRYESDVAGVRILTPMMAIETVAAGGGSICRFDGVALTVGPDSAGADPGPACYGGGGPLTVTDLNVALGRIPTSRFPFPLDTDAVRRRLDAIRFEVERASGKTYTAESLAEEFLLVANAAMTRPVRSVSVARGCDPRDHALVGFGGAAPQHACAIARMLGVRTIINHPDGGLLSARGIGIADDVRHSVRGIYRIADDESIEAARRSADDVETELRASMSAPSRIVREIELRYVGRDASLVVAFNSDPLEAYEREHRRLHGYLEERDIEIATVRVMAIDDRPAPDTPVLEDADGPLRSAEDVQAWFGGRWRTAPVFERSVIRCGHQIKGPAIVADPFSALIVEPGWTAEAAPDGLITLKDSAPGSTRTVDEARDPAMLEVFNHQFASIAEQMGEALRRTATSVNVKTRLDYSCALFTASGDLLVNAPHMPVHLGAMSETLRETIARFEDVKPGDVYMSNDPFAGGSHLPDVTVMTPLFDGSDLLFWTASRAHHAEIGGVTPGSMPPFSETLAEEGVLIAPMRIIDGGALRFDEIERLLTEGKWPSRNPADNLADLRAQIAANWKGVLELERVIDRYGAGVVVAYAGHVMAAAAEKMQARLQTLEEGRRTFTDQLDDGAVIHVSIEIAGGSATVDFTGSAGVSRTNLNANRAIVRAAVLYAFRLLLDEDIPINDGVLEPLEIVIPEGLLSPRPGPSPDASPAVAGGNVETSQRLVDVLLGALGLAAASQGTMNNFLFGDESFGYYETICGGAGATPNAPGADAVHTHMTNTRLTDPEVLESRYPVRVECFEIRRGSGGRGRHRGGDGVVRSFQFLRPLRVSLLTQRRGPVAPYGLAGGEPGAVGRQMIRRADGHVESLPWRASLDVEAGDIITVETPGGGGWGEAGQ